MWYQIIIRDVGNWLYILNIILVIFARFLDMFSTYYISKELQLETNKLARRLGWKGMIIMQIPIIILGSLDFYFALFIFCWSLLLFGNNIQGSWYVKKVGEEAYQKELSSQLDSVKSWKIIFSELSYLITFSFTGLLIILAIFIYNDKIAVFFISLALICQGIIGSVRTIHYLLELKKEKKK
ncbi:MAG: hypothetical protein ACFFBW_02110 [Promethearchaeota archaeon]